MRDLHDEILIAIGIGFISGVAVTGVLAVICFALFR